MSKTALAILAVLSTSITLADDFKTIDGKEYKNAKVSRVEPDGLVLMTKSGISKVYFVELPEDVQQRFGYGPAKAAEFNKAELPAAGQFNANVQPGTPQQRIGDSGTAAELRNLGRLSRLSHRWKGLQRTTLNTLEISTFVLTSVLICPDFRLRCSISCSCC